MDRIKKVIKKNFFLKKIIDNVYHKINPFSGSESYWEKRYQKGGNSGSGSYNRLAQFKAKIINDFIKANDIQTVIEFGCGDGNQLALAQYQNYIGLDVSSTVINRCKEKFKEDKNKKFYLYPSNEAQKLKANVSLSLDVIFHLVEDAVYEKYMDDLFKAANEFVIIYSSNYDKPQKYHERDREFLSWVKNNARDWKLLKKVNNKFPFDPQNADETSKSDFYFFKKIFEKF